MCSIQTVRIGEQTVRVADIKTEYVKNIAEAAASCSYIDKVVLFGSAIRNDCREDSDIDIAVFGNQAKGKVLTSSKYRSFLNKISAYDDFSQTYDILYFRSGKNYTDGIMVDIEQGEVLYAK